MSARQVWFSVGMGRPMPGLAILIVDDRGWLDQNDFFRHDFVLAAIAADFEGKVVLLVGSGREFGVSVDISCGKKVAAIFEFCVESYFLFFIT